MNIFYELLLSFSPDVDGFVFMWVLLLIFFLFVYLTLRQLVYYSRTGNVNPDKFRLRMKKLLLENKEEEAISICNAGGKRGLTQIVKAALDNRTKPPGMIRSHVEEKVVAISSKIERRVPFFAALGNIATLIGLMGTIYGLVLAFSAVGKPGVAAAEKTSMLASGISTAMNTTLFGLIIAVPCLFAYSYFQTRATNLIEFLDRQAVSILNCIFTTDTKLKNYKPSQRRRRSEANIDLDITPIMGLMVVLIPLLLSSAEFVKIGTIEMNLPKSGKGGMGAAIQESKPRQLSLGLLVLKDGIHISSSLSEENKSGANEETSKPEPQVEIKNNDFNYPKLTAKLSVLKRKVLIEILSDKRPKAELEQASIFQLSKWMEEADKEDMFHYKDYETIKIMADNTMEFQKIINIMDASREITIKNRKIPLFPSVSIGAGI